MPGRQLEAAGSARRLPRAAAKEPADRCAPRGHGVYPGMRKRSLEVIHDQDEDTDQPHVDEQEHIHHFRHIQFVRPDLVGDIEHFRHGDGVGDGRRLDQVDEVVVERGQADAERQRQDDVDVGLQAAVAETFGGFERFPRHRFNAGAENLDIEGAGPERQAYRCPGEIRNQRRGDAVGGRHAQIGAEPEIKEIELDERRRIAEELDIALRRQPQHAQPRALNPRADHADDDAADDADRHQANRSEKSVEETGAVERVVKDRQIDSGRIVKRPEPIPDRLQVHQIRRSNKCARTLRMGRPRSIAQGPAIYTCRASPPDTATAECSISSRARSAGRSYASSRACRA